MSTKMKFGLTTTWILAVAVLILLWVIHPIVASAQGSGSVVPVDTTGSPVGDLLLMFMKVIFSALGLVTTWLTTKAITYFHNKTKIDIPAATEQMLFDWADQAVGLAYEKAHQVLQKTGKALDGSAKLNIAVQFVMDLAQKHNLEGVLEEKIKNYIEAKLGVKRLEDVGVGTAVTAGPSETVVVAK